MGDYYKTSATYPEPAYVEPEVKGQPLQQQQLQHPRQQQQLQQVERGQRRSGDLQPAEVNPTLRERCMGLETTLCRCLPLILLFFYTLLGAMIFHLTEAPIPDQTAVYKNFSRNLCQQKYANHTYTNQLQKRMEEIVVDANYTNDVRRREVHQALRWYLSVLDANHTIEIKIKDGNKWRFPEALMYSMTLYTTIGYGDPAAETTTGQVLTVIYSIIGIPLALAALIELGFLIGLVVGKLWSCLRRSVHTMSTRGNFQPLSTSSSYDAELRRLDEESDNDLLTFPLSALVFLTFIWILISAAVFYAWEYPEWSFGRAMYFAFITFTTIGLGDTVPKTDVGQIVGIFFILIGLSLVSTTLAVMQNQINALESSIERAIDLEYMESQTGTGQAMATDDRAVDDQLRNIVNKLPPGSRFLYWLMPENAKQNLRKYYQKKASMTGRGVQTDDYLWAMTTMSKSFLKNNDGGGERREDLDDVRSHDDVSSLVALCDYSLKY